MRFNSAYFDVTLNPSSGVASLSANNRLSYTELLETATGTNSVTMGLAAGTVTITGGSGTGVRTVTVSATFPYTPAMDHWWYEHYDIAPQIQSATLTVQPQALRVGSVSGQATEGGGKATFPVRLWTQPSAAVTVSVASRDTGEGTVAPSSLTFSTSSWNTAQTVTVTGVQDTVDDGDATWNVRLDPASGDANYNRLDSSDVSVTTTDDDGPPGVTLALDPSSIAESGTGNVATVTARLSHASGAATTVTVAAGTAWAAGTDATIVIAAGATTDASDTATVVAVDNTRDEPDRTGTVTATITNARAAADSTTMAVTGAALTVRDDDAAPTAALSLDPASVSENGGLSTVTATLSHPSSEPSTVTVAAVSGLFTVGADATITIAAGATTAAADTVLVTAVDDVVHQGTTGRSATVTATLANGQGAGAVTGAALTLTDDETLPTLALVLSPGSVSELSGLSTVTATLSGPSSAAVTVTVTTTPLASSGAVSGDFTQTGTTLTIATGSTTSTGLVTVTGNDNDVDAPNKSVTVSATAAGGNGVANPSSATLTLTDDEATATATLVLTPSSISENGGVSTVTARLSHRTTEATTLTVAAAAGAGAVAADFSLSSTTALTIAAGATASAGTVTVTAVDNAVVSSDKQVTVSATAAGGRGVASPASATLTLRDDEVGLNESAVSGPATEGGGQATFTVALRRQPTAAVTVAVTSLDTGEGTVDPSSLTFMTGGWNTAQTVTVTGVDDAVHDGDVTWQVRLDPASGDASYDGLSNVEVDVTTTDNDAAPDAVLSLSRRAVTENGGVATVSAALSHPSSEPTTVTVTAAPGSYTVGVDATITIAAGATTGGSDTATVRAVDDGVHQGSAGRRVTVTAALANGRGAGSVTGAGLTLRDDESLPVAGLVLAPSSVSESGGVAAVSATLSGASSEAVTLTVVAAAGPGTAAGDFTRSGTTLTLAAGATTSTGTVTVTANGNDVDAPDKQVTVSATAAGGNGVASPRDVTLTLIDDDVVTDLATGRGSIAYAQETLTATLDSGGVTYYVVSSPPAPGRWSMTAPAGRAAAAGSTLQVRFVLGDMVFAGADAPALSAPAAGSSTPLSGALVSGGAAGDPEAIFSVVVPTGRSIASDAVMALTVRSLGVRVDRAGTVRVGTRLGTSGAFSPGEPVPVVRVASGLRETADPASPVTRIGDGFRTFAGALAASVGRLSVGPPEGARLYRAADGAPAELEDMTSQAPGANRITFSGRLGFVEDVFLSDTADCSTRDGAEVLDAGGAWAAVDLGNANHRRLCLEVDGTTSIPETGFYQASVDYTGIAGARFPPADVAGLGLGRVTRGGVTVHLSYVNTHPNVNFRVVVRNRMDEPAPYRFEFTPPEGTSAVGGPQAEGALPANALTLLRAANFVTVTGRRPWTGARLTVDASPERLDVVTIQTNRSDGSTDTVRYNVPDASDR